ncbi:VOC family protein [Parasphingorhabdus sp.]|uniref:VOC family protein n=1 Tax=Parasphingorhabdus sp. TaxID=2709688 RepID=UPI0030015982
MITALHHVQLAMPEAGEDQARGFYAEILDIPERTKPAKLQGNGGCWFERENVRVHLGIESDFRSAKKAHPAFQTSDFHDLMKKLKNAGYLIQSADAIDHHARFFVNDPFGNRIEFINAEREF